MNTEQDLLNKLMISKKIMEKHNTMSRGSSQDISGVSNIQVEDYQPVNAKYNLPEDVVMESSLPKAPQQTQPMTKDRIMGSKLPDEIKQLMLEHPIEQPNMGSSSAISNELVEKAARLMNTKANGDPINENVGKRKQPTQTTQSSFNPNELRDIIRETVEDVLKENGLLVESTSRADEVFKFRVGNHLFEGKVTKIKKISK